MTLPLYFHEKHNFSLLVEALGQDVISGRFEVRNQNLQLSNPFSGLVYQLTHNIYKFTFSMEWAHLHVPSCTTFIGTLYAHENGKGVLDLEWLLVNDNKKGSLRGSSHLIEQADTGLLNRCAPSFQEKIMA